jgi:hypothetical protein
MSEFRQIGLPWEDLDRACERNGGNENEGGTNMRVMATRLGIVAAMIASMLTVIPAGAMAGTNVGTVTLTNEDFRYGTYIIDEPGTYRLGEDISFNPNSPDTLSAAVDDGSIPVGIASQIGLVSPVDAYHAGFPLFTQYASGGADGFTPGGPLDARYDPAAYGIGFFAAIAITADDVVLDLNGHRIEQSAEHALLQRFFAVVELSDQPFIPSQGPFNFGIDLDGAQRVTIKNGVIGRSSHHGVHGNGNKDITIRNVDFVDYEVGALALNGVNGLDVINVTALNRKDVPVLGTFSSAQFIKLYIEDLLRSGSQTTLTVGGVALSAADIKSGLIDAINNTHGDIVANPNIVEGRAQIDSAAHPVEFALFHNQFGVVDGNSYSFLVNRFGVAVGGFPYSPDGVASVPSHDVRFANVRVMDQVGAINEVPALDIGGAAAKDPIGAVFQTQNRNPDTNAPVTTSATDGTARYTGNPAANAQAFVAKAQLNGDFAESSLDLSRQSISPSILSWVEAAPGSESLDDIGATYLCNGDSMFHVNKGVIAFKMDAAQNVRLTNTGVSGLENLGAEGTGLCGDYLGGKSHPDATLNGYGGSTVRAYTFSGTQDVLVVNASARGLTSAGGTAIGFDILTDSSDIRILSASVADVNAASDSTMSPDSPTEEPWAYGYYVGAEAGSVNVWGCASELSGQYGEAEIHDLTGTALWRSTCGGGRGN